MNNIVLSVNKSQITSTDILNSVDEILHKLQETGDLGTVSNALVSLEGISNISGIAKAKLLYGTKTWWQETGQDNLTGDTFEDWAYSVSTILTPPNIKRYIDVWNMWVEQAELPDLIKEMPIREQIPIATTLANGYEISDDEWEEISNATSLGEVQAILRRIKGKEPRRGSMQLKEERDGSVNAWVDGQKHFVLFFNRQEEESDPIVAKAISRVSNSSGIIKR